MHQAARDFVERITRSMNFTDLRILEIGSRNVNGTIRPLFAGNSEYIGIDRQAGPGVDIVSDLRDFTGTDFDVVISMEAMEHDPRPECFIEGAERFLKPGGMLILTAAAPGRQPHNCSGSPWDGIEPYNNISPESLGKWLAGWQVIILEHNEEAADVYVAAIKEVKNVRDSSKPKRVSRE